MLSVKGLKAEVDGKEILHGLDFQVNPGEVHAIMGPNGSGKSTFAHILAGRDGYEVTGGDVKFVALDAVRDIQRLDQFVADNRGLEPRGNILQQHGELVPPQAREYVFVAEVPKSPVGKILRRKLVAGEYEPEATTSVR